MNSKQDRERERFLITKLCPVQLKKKHVQLIEWTDCLIASPSSVQSTTVLLSLEGEWSIWCLSKYTSMAFQFCSFQELNTWRECKQGHGWAKSDLRKLAYFKAVPTPSYFRDFLSHRGFLYFQVGTKGHLKAQADLCCVSAKICKEIISQQ